VVFDNEREKVGIFVWNSKGKGESRLDFPSGSLYIFHALGETFDFLLLL
jgi:hypothetical protein